MVGSDHRGGSSFDREFPGEYLRKMSRIRTLGPPVVLSAILFLTLSAGGSVADLATVIPKSVLDWQAAGDDKTYDTKTIYDYLDGGAEVYLAFDLEGVFVRKFKGPAGDEIALDVYAMKSAEEAFGVFSCDRQDPGAGIGQESEYGPGLLRFRQGRYFVSVTASGDEKRSEAAMLALGKAVAPALGPAGGLPSLTSCLPGQGLVPDRTCFFHSVVNLNNRFFISSDNILGLDRSTDCVLAEYAAAPDLPAKLLLVKYPDAAKAAAAHRSFLASYLHPGPGREAARTANGAVSAARLSGRFLALVFDAPAEEFATALFAAIRYPSE